MKGLVEIFLGVGRESFHVVLKRKLTILNGNSGVGKTVFFNHVKRYLENESISADVELSLKGCRGIYIPSYTDSDWDEKILNKEEYVILVDEDNKNILKFGNIGEIIRESNNYFLIITREDIKEDGTLVKNFKVGNIGQSTKAQITFEGRTELRGLDNYTVNSSSLLYSRKRISFKPDLIIVEDLKSGYQFFRDTVDDSLCTVDTARTKTRVIKKLKSYLNSKKYKRIYIVVDGENFGFEIDEIAQIKRFVEKSSNMKIEIADIRSFEWLLLSTGFVFKEDMFDIVENTFNYCDVYEYNNWEKFYTSIMENGSFNSSTGKEFFTREDKLEYKKKDLNREFLSKRFVSSIYDLVGDIDRSLLKSEYK